jgi:hypothetical protein
VTGCQACQSFARCRGHLHREAQQYRGLERQAEWVSSACQSRNMGEGGSKEKEVEGDPKGTFL